MLAEASTDTIAHQRWLLDNGLINDLHKDNLFLYGSIVHRNVKFVEVSIDYQNKLISYTLYFDKKDLNTINRFQILSTSNTIIGLWQFKRLLNKEGNLNIPSILSKFVKDYCGIKWSAAVELKDYEQYKEDNTKPNN